MNALSNDDTIAQVNGRWVYLPCAGYQLEGIVHSMHIAHSS
jgi:hypothetical protein